MTEKSSPLYVIAREQRDRGNPYPFVIARSASDVAIRIFAMRCIARLTKAAKERIPTGLTALGMTL